jgi:hypothetical protein
MRDFALDDGFLQSCIDLPENIREKMLSQLQIYTKRPRDRDLGVARVEGSKHILSLPLDDTYRIVLHREKSVTTLLVVAENNSTIARAISKRKISPDHMVTAPVDALETLLVEGKYLLLAKHLVNVPSATRELRFKVSEIEGILNAHLPPEARRFLNWWANQKSGKRAQAFAWMAAGWLVSKVDFNADLVKFVRRNLEFERVG